MPNRRSDLKAFMAITSVLERLLVVRIGKTGSSGGANSEPQFPWFLMCLILKRKIQPVKRKIAHILR
jgi:hypothetical protein